MECDMTKGPAARLVLSFTIPLFFGNLFQQLYAMVDTIIVGRFVGVEALAAVGATGGFSFMVIGFAQGLTAGFSVIISQRFGAKDMDGVRKAFAQSFICSALLSLLLAAVFGFLSMPLLRLIQTPENIISDANDYILIIYLGIGTSIFYNLFSSILRAVGDGKSPVIFLLISSALNVVLDLFFVITVPLACYHYAYYYLGSRSIYVMRRLPDRWEQWRRCLAVPVLLAAVFLLAIELLTFVYFLKFLLETPDPCLPSDPWRQLLYALGGGRA